MDALSRLAVFVAVARQQSFAGAARELGLTPSAVSKQVLNLEAELRCKLLNRTTRQVSLTEEGALLFERAGRALADLQEAKEELNELKATPRGLLRVSVPTTLGNLYLKEPLTEFALRYPDVTLDVQFEDRLIDLADEGFDVVLRIAALADSSLVARKLAACPFYLCASPAYLAAHGTPRTPADLSHHNVLAYTRNKGAHEWRYQAPDGSQGVVALQSNFRCDYAELMVAAASAGIGIMISPLFFVDEALKQGQLITVLDDYRTHPPRNLYAVYPANRYASTRLRLFVDHLATFFAARFGTSVR